MFQKGKKNPHSGGLNIMIVGCGKVGMTLVDRLSKEGHDISVVDKNAARLQSVTHMHDVYGVVGNGASFTVLKEAGIENTDILISVTDSDELNLLCCLVAKRSGHCEVIARVRTPDYSEEKAYLKEKLGLAMMINPEQEAANAISRILYMPTALEVAPFARGHAEMVRIKLPEGNVLTGKRIADLGSELSGAVLICAVERSGEVYIPGGNFELAAGDVISFIAPVRDGRKFLKRNGADVVIYPEKNVAEQIAIAASSDNIFDCIPFVEDYYIAEIRPMERWLGRTVLDVNFRARYNLNIVAVKQGEGVIPIPGPNYVFNEDEHIMVLGHINDIRRVAY